MTPQQWKQVEELFHAASERGTDLLADADPVVRREVERLLSQAEGGSGKLLDRDAAELAEDLAEAEIAPGSRLGPYKIESLLGSGGMGQVFRATDTRLGRLVAIKVSHERFSDRFEREARSIAALNHPNICTLYDVGPNYLVMEFVEGETLAARLERGGTSLEQTLRYGAEIAGALAAAHAKGIVHRDLKPGNVMLPAAGVKVLDFGLAKSGQDATVTLGLMGTPAYMAPEQFEGKRCDARTDIYSLGLVLFQMATGKPFVPGDRLATGALTPPQLSHIVERCIAREPEDRWQSASDVRRELEWVEKTNAAPPGRAARGKRRVGILSVIANVVLAAALMALFFYWRPKPAAPAPATRFEIAPPQGTLLTFNFALSPDGSKLAFAAKSGIRAQIWVRLLDSGRAYPLAGTEDSTGDPGWAPIWSPDNRYLVFASGGLLRKIDASGGSAQLLCPLPGLFERGFWTKDDRIVFATSGHTSLLQVSAAGGPVTPVTALSGQEARHYSPSILPDGNHFLFLRIAEPPGQASFLPFPNGPLHLASLDAKPQHQTKLLSPDAAFTAFVPAGGWGAKAQPDINKGYLMSVVRNTLVAQPFDARRLALTGEATPIAENVAFDGFSASSNGILVYLPQEAAGERRLTWLDRQGASEGTVGESFGPLDGGMTPSLAPDGKRLVFIRSDRQTMTPEVWLYEFERGVSTRLTSKWSQSPVWSPDGGSVAFLRQRGGVRGVYRISSNLTGVEELLYPLNNGEFVVPTSWSRDGRYLLLQGSTGGTSGIWALPAQAAGEQKLIALATGQFTQSTARFSPDGRFFSYAAKEADQEEIFVQSFDPGSGASSRNGSRKWKVSEGGALTARWRSDGKEIVYQARNGDMMAVEVSTSPVFHAEAPKRLFNQPAPSLDWDMSRDGQRFLFLLSQQAPAPYTVVLNWTSLLPK